MFACLVRVPASALRHLHQLLIPGFYAEPRAPGGSAPHAGFAVVWLPEADYPKALRVLRTCPQAVALTRLGKRYGVRCREADEQFVHQTLRPGMAANASICRASLQTGITASGRTKRLILYDDGEEGPNGVNPDPWSGGRDPWSVARPPPGLPPPAAPASSGTQTKITQLREEQLS